MNKHDFDGIKEGLGEAISHARGEHVPGLRVHGPRVFAVVQPTGRDEHGEVRPTMDLSPAAEFGELRFILGSSHNPFTDLQATAITVRAVLEEVRFCADDWLLLVGSPILIGLVSAVAVDMTGVLRCLQWSRRGVYLPAEATIFEPEEEAA